MRTNRQGNKWLYVIAFSVAFLILFAAVHKFSASAAPPLPGAIFTTNVSGTRVNQNQYTNKCDVYLDGGPGANAPVTAAGLPNGDYYFQVTDPSGKTLLSTDPVMFRQFHVSGGVISGVSGAGNHGTGFDTTNNGATIQLCPYLDTPNPGGVYKAWVTQVGDFVGDPTKVDSPCGNGCFHGFIPAASKVDNFKVNGQAVGIACLGVFKFIDNNGNGVRDANDPLVLGWGFRVIDPLGAEVGGTLFTESEKNCEPGLFNLAPGRYTVIEDATNGTGNFVVTANILDGSKQNPVDTQVSVRILAGDFRHDVTFGNHPLP